MRKLQMKMSMSLDGFVADAGGKADWIFKTGDEESKAWSLEQCKEAGLHIMGRKSFEMMSAYWPGSNDVFAAPMNAIPKAVFTRKGFNVDSALKDSANTEAWANARVFDSDLVKGVKDLKGEPGKPISAIGGAAFMRSLLATGLIDEFHLAIHPVILGSGLPIFNGLANPQYLRLVDAKAFPGGTVVHTYSK